MPLTPFLALLAVVILAGGLTAVALSTLGGTDAALILPVSLVAVWLLRRRS